METEAETEAKTEEALRFSVKLKNGAESTNGSKDGKNGT